MKQRKGSRGIQKPVSISFVERLGRKIFAGSSPRGVRTGNPGRRFRPCGFAFCRAGASHSVPAAARTPHPYSSLARTVVVLLTLLIASPGAFAQDEIHPGISDREVLYDLYEGQKVKVVRTGATKAKGRKIEGKLVEVREDAIIIRRKKEADRAAAPLRFRRHIPAPAPIFQRMTYERTRAAVFSHAAAQALDRKRRSDLQWNQMKVLPPGARLVVEMRDGGWVKGRFVAVDNETLTLQRHTRFEDLPRPSVLRVRLVGDRNTGKGAWWGFLVGGVAGSVLSGATCAAFDEVGFGVCVGFAVYGGFILGGFGAGVGAGVGSFSREKTLIYEAFSPERLSRSLDVVAPEIIIEKAAVR